MHPQPRLKNRILRLLLLVILLGTFGQIVSCSKSSSPTAPLLLWPLTKRPPRHVGTT